VIETLISDKNPLLKEVRRLAAGGASGEDRLVLAEGPRLLDEAVRSGIAIHAVILAESTPEIAAVGTARVVRVLDGLFNKLASTESPQGVLSLVRLPEWTPEDLLRGTPLVVVLDGIQDPGNAGAILRTAEAFGASGAVFLKARSARRIPNACERRQARRFVCRSLTKSPPGSRSMRPIPGQNCRLPRPDSSLPAALSLEARGVVSGPNWRRARPVSKFPLSRLNR
jgi:hypothetical protein